MEQSQPQLNADMMAAIKADYILLSTPGNVGFYLRCAVVELFLIHRTTGQLFPFFTLATFEDELPAITTPVYNGVPIPINKEYKIGVRVFEMTTEDAHRVFLDLLEKNRWSPSNDGKLALPPLRALARQYVPPIGNYRTNQILKNNFYGGSHLLEFFDEQKEALAFLTKADTHALLDKITAVIQDRTTLNFAVNLDRLGNIIFQFPVNILQINFKIEENATRYRLYFDWCPQLAGIAKKCTIVCSATLDKTIINNGLYPYNQQAEQVIPIKDIDHEAILEIVDTETGLLLNKYNHGAPRAVALSITLQENIARIFYIEDRLQHVSIKQTTTPTLRPIQFRDHIAQSVYTTEKKELISQLDFKQYQRGSDQEALVDIRQLIDRHDRQGAFLWDPYLRATDILNTLYFSTTYKVPLRAICSMSKKREDLKENAGLQSLRATMHQQRTQLSRADHNNHGLNLEFRAQHSHYGYDFHDRFLLFPAYGRNAPRVYSLGTSVNGIGKSHHILQLVAYPQPILDAFHDLWEQLNQPDCLIWKAPDT